MCALTVGAAAASSPAAKSSLPNSRCHPISRPALTRSCWPPIGNPSAPQTFDYSPPAAPTGLSATVGNHQLTLSWNSLPGATAYNVKRSTTSGSYYVTLTTVTGTNFTNTGLVNGTTYYYVVTAVGSGGPSSNSAELAAAPFGPPPAPTGLVAGPDSYVGVSLSWNAVSGATSYNVKRSNTSGGPFTTIASRATPDYNDTNVIAGNI